MPKPLSDALGAQGSHYYPTPDQLKDPHATARSLRVILDQFYSLQDQHDALKKSHEDLLAKSSTSATTPPPGSGPTDSMLLGLHIVPIDTLNLANGATLKFSKANGNFIFS
jgi:hypothetical protein